MSIKIGYKEEKIIDDYACKLNDTFNEVNVGAVLFAGDESSNNVISNKKMIKKALKIIEKKIQHIKDAKDEDDLAEHIKLKKLIKDVNKREKRKK